MTAFHCTGDLKERVRSLTIQYHHAMQQGLIPVGDAQSQADLAVQYAKDAFRNPPVFHFPPTVAVPSHCLHLDLLTEERLDVALSSATPVEAVNAASELTLAKSGADSMYFAFTDCSGAEQLRQYPNDESIRGLFRRASLLSHCQLPVLVNTGLQRVLEDTRTELTVFRNETITQSQLAARCVVWSLQAMVTTSVEERGTMLALLDSLLARPDVSAAAAQLLARFHAAPLQAILDDIFLFLVVHVETGQAKELTHGCNVLSLVYRANFLEQPNGIVPFDKFYLEVLSEFDERQIRDDFVRKLKKEFSFCSYPFLLTARFKSVLLLLEASLERDGAFRHAVISNLFTNRGAQAMEDYFLVLQVSRANLVETTLRQLWRKGDKLRQPLRIQFTGEEGVDEGGLKKEFFQLLTKELLSPNFNMFFVPPGSRSLWFVPTVRNSSNESEFFLIGQIIGLAVYNNIILDLSFPLTIFKKLLGVPTTEQDLALVDPDMRRGLQDLLEFEETEGMTIEEIFCRNFVYEHDIFGSKVELPIVPNGENIVLTSANRAQFVHAVTHHILDDSIASNFNKFKEGFLSVCNRSLVLQLRPEELEQLVCGNPTLNFDELEETTSYEGYEGNEPVIAMFWTVVKEFSIENKRKFLRFCTGSDRVPVGGLRDLHFYVGRNGGDSELLPTAHTCFNHLLLPEYDTQEKLRTKLLLAVENCEGFYGGK